MLSLDQLRQLDRDGKQRAIIERDEQAIRETIAALEEGTQNGNAA